MNQDSIRQNLVNEKISEEEERKKRENDGALKELQKRDFVNTVGMMQRFGQKYEKKRMRITAFVPKLINENSKIVTNFADLSDSTEPEESKTAREKRVVEHNGVKYYEAILPENFFTSGDSNSDNHQSEFYKDYYGGDECLQAMKKISIEKTKAWLQLTIFKYTWRLGEKKGTTAQKDLEKIIWYSERLKELYENET